jgi:hypothetical protein
MSFYPTANILAISEGFDKSLDFCSSIVTREAIKQTDIVRFINRNYSLIYDHGKSLGVTWYLQLDPDSLLLREIIWPNLKDLWYGQIVTHKSLVTTWGCCELKHDQIVKELASASFTPWSYEKGLSRDLTKATYLNKMYKPTPWSDVHAKLHFYPKIFLYPVSIIHPVPINGIF